LVLERWIEWFNICVGGLLKTNDGGWIRLAAFGPRAMDRIVQHMGVELEVQHMGVELEDISKEMIEEMVAGLTRDDAVKLFTDIGLPCAPVFSGKV